jgi:hypothetical protein
MTDGFEVTTESDSVTVLTEAFTLVFSKEHVGIASFKYETSGSWHECVETGNTPPTLFAPYFQSLDVSGNLLYPSGGYSQAVTTALPQFVQIVQSGYMRNPSIPDCTDYSITITWTLWPSGRLFCHIIIQNLSNTLLILSEEAYRLNPVGDPDIHPGRDEAPNLNWFGFYSNNMGPSSYDRSHDCIVVPFQSGLDHNSTDGNTNRIYRTTITFAPNTSMSRDFMIALSAYGSHGDCTGADDFQSRGDALSSDFTLPDPLDASPNAGQVLVGTRIGDGFDEEHGGYTLVAI